MSNFEFIENSSETSLPPALQLAQDRVALNRACYLAGLRRQQAIADRLPPPLQYLGQRQGQPLLVAPGGQPFRAGTTDTNGSILPGVRDIAAIGDLVRVGGIPRVQVTTIEEPIPNVLDIVLLVSDIRRYPGSTTLEEPNLLPSRCALYLKTNDGLPVKIFEQEQTLTGTQTIIDSGGGSTLGLKESEFEIINISTFDESTLIVQAAEIARIVLNNPDDTATFEFKVSTVIVQNGAAQAIESPVQQITNPNQVDISYPSRLAQYANFLIPSYTSPARELAFFLQPPAYTHPDRADYANRYLLKEQEFTILRDEAIWIPSWVELTQAAVFAPQNSAGAIYPGLSFVWNTTDFEAIGLPLDTLYYEGENFSNPLGTIADFLASSTASDFYVRDPIDPSKLFNRRIEIKAARIFFTP